MLEKIEGRRRRGWQSISYLDGIADSMDMSLSQPAPGVGEGQRSVACCSPWGHKQLDTTKQLNNNILLGPKGFQYQSLVLKT